MDGGFETRGSARSLFKWLKKQRVDKIAYNMCIKDVSGTLSISIKCGKIGFLPNRHVHVRAEVSRRQFMYKHELVTSLFSLLTYFKFNKERKTEPFCLDKSKQKKLSLLTRVLF